MKRIMLLTALAGAVAIGSAGIANAQNCSAPGVLTSVKGTVLVSSGGSFSPASVGTPVSLGTKVTVQGSGSAVASFGGTNVTVPSSTTLTLSIPGCVSPTFGASAAASTTTTTVVVTTVVIAGGVGAAIALSNDSDNKIPFFPVSP